jgi:hypothetical protein
LSLEYSRCPASIFPQGSNCIPVPTKHENGSTRKRWCQPASSAHPTAPGTGQLGRYSPKQIFLGLIYNCLWTVKKSLFHITEVNVASFGCFLFLIRYVTSHYNEGSIGRNKHDYSAKNDTSFASEAHPVVGNWESVLQGVILI